VSTNKQSNGKPLGIVLFPLKVLGTQGHHKGTPFKETLNKEEQIPTLLFKNNNSINPGIV